MLVRNLVISSLSENYSSILKSGNMYKCSLMGHCVQLMKESRHLQDTEKVILFRLEFQQFNCLK